MGAFNTVNYPCKHLTEQQTWNKNISKQLDK